MKLKAPWTFWIGGCILILGASISSLAGGEVLPGSLVVTGSADIGGDSELSQFTAFIYLEDASAHVTTGSISIDGAFKVNVFIPNASIEVYYDEDGNPVWVNASGLSEAGFPANIQAPGSGNYGGIGLTCGSPSR